MRLDGGRVAARGFQYQYLRTLESVLALVDDSRVIAIRVEGPASYNGHADSVDFDIIDVNDCCTLAVQVKSKLPGASVSGPEAFGVLTQLVAGHDALSYQLLTNGTPTPNARRLAAALAAAETPTGLKDRLEEILATAPQRLAQLRALSSVQLERLTRCRVLFDQRDDVEIRQALRESLRRYRNRVHAGLGQRSAGMLTGYLVSEILRRAADGSESVFTIEQLRSHLLISADELAGLSGVRDWGVVVGAMPAIPDVERPVLLRELISALHRQRSDGVRRAALIGPSGIGKSSLAVAYVADQADSYDVIFWVDGETSESLLVSFRRIATYLDPRDSEHSYHATADHVRLAVHTQLSLLAGRWAIVFDNVSDQREVDPWIPRAGRGDIITTSIDSTARHGSAVVIDVDAMDQPQAIELLSRRLRLSVSQDERYADELWRLADGLSCWPLALELASGYLDTCGIRIADVDHYLDQLKIRSLADPDSLPPAYPRTLAAALTLCIEQLQSRIIRSGRDYRPGLALGMLVNAAYLASRQLPVHLLAVGTIGGTTPEETTGPFLLPPGVASIGEVIRELRRFSLVSYDEDLPPTEGEQLSDADRTITVNSIVQDIIRAQTDRHVGAAEALSRLTYHVERWLTAVLELNLFERASIMVNHADTLVKHLHRLDLHGPYLPLLYGNLAGAHRANGEPGKAERFLRAELDLLSKSAEPNELLAAQAKLSLVEISFTTPGAESLTVDECLTYLEQILQYAIIVGADYPRAAVKFALDIKVIVEYPPAAAHLNQFAALSESVDSLLAEHGPTSYSQLIEEVNRADLLVSEGQLEEAEEICHRALESDSLIGMMELTARRILVESLTRQRKLRAARDEFRDFRRIFGSTSFHLETILHFAHNVGNGCVLIILTENDQDAIALLDDLLDWPVISDALARPSIEVSSRLRLLSAARDLAHGNSSGARKVLKLLRPVDLQQGPPNETKGWCTLWQMIRLATFRTDARRYIRSES
jgi:tetratricopeptide (TPR) repeat protein